jgi:hypothetical protein
VFAPRFWACAYSCVQQAPHLPRHCGRAIGGYRRARLLARNERAEVALGAEVVHHLDRVPPVEPALAVRHDERVRKLGREAHLEVACGALPVVLAREADLRGVSLPSSYVARSGGSGGGGASTRTVFSGGGDQRRGARRAWSAAHADRRIRWRPGMA